MSSKIAVIFNEENELSSFESGTYLLIFNKDNTWQVTNEIRYSLDITTSMSDIRDNIRTIILKLEDCKTIIGKTVTGLPYNILERMGFDIYEATAISEELLDEISSELEAYNSRQINYSEETPTAPVPTSTDGVYFLNLIELQEKHPEISSKKALQSFIETCPFYKLEVICSHIPPWFDIILPQKRMTYNVEELNKSQLKVSIAKKVCEC